jgi:hypothetical protein
MTSLKILPITSVTVITGVYKRIVYPSNKQPGSMNGKSRKLTKVRTKSPFSE